MEQCDGDWPSLAVSWGLAADRAFANDQLRFGVHLAFHKRRAFHALVHLTQLNSHLGSRPA